MGLIFYGNIKLDEKIAKRISNQYWLGSQFITQCALRLGVINEDSIINLLTQIENTRYLQIDNDSIFKICCLFLNIALELSQKAGYTTEKNTEILRDLFYCNESHSFSDINIGGISHTSSKKILFDFSDKKFENCRFEGYDFFWACEANENTFFTNCHFSSLMLIKGITPKLKASNFDIPTCKFDQECREIIDIATQDAEADKSKIISEIRSFIKLFNAGGHLSRERSEDALYSYTAGRGSVLGSLLNILIDEGFIKLKLGRASRAYYVNSEFRRDLEDFVYQSNARPSIQKLLHNFINW
jgi:hypothetical protein